MGPELQIVVTHKVTVSATADGIGFVFGGATVGEALTNMLNAVRNNAEAHRVTLLALEELQRQIETSFVAQGGGV